MVLVIGMECMVTCLLSIQMRSPVLVLGICSQIKLAAMEKLVSFPAKIHTHTVICYNA